VTVGDRGLGTKVGTTFAFWSANISTVRPLLRFSKAQHVTICPAEYLRVEDALRMIVFGIGQLIAFAVEDESGAFEVSDQ
jgi:hypothetical protein